MSIIQLITQYQGVLYLVGNAAVAGFMLVMTAKFTPRAKHEALAVRVTDIEKKISNMPTVEVIHQLALSITELKGELRGIPLRFERVDALAERLQKQVDRVEEFLDQRGL